jgi:hypothetical protein
VTSKARNSTRASGDARSLKLSGRLGLSSLFFDLLFEGVVPSRLCAQSLDACRPAPEVKAALDKLPAQSKVNQSSKTFYEQKRTALLALVNRYPSDIFVNRAYIEFESTLEGRDRLVSHATTLAKSHPGDAGHEYLEGLALTGLHARGRQTVEAGLGQQPKVFAAAAPISRHLLIAELSRCQEAGCQLEGFS